MKALFGVGLRSVHFHYLEEHRPREIDFFEVITENFFKTKGRPRTLLEKIRQDYPITCHGVSLSIAGNDDIDLNYLNAIKTFFDEISPVGVSDHLCFTRANGLSVHNLLPFPFTKENLTNLKNRIDYVQNFLKRPMSFENLSAYLQYTDSEMSEWEFISELQITTGCKILLDLNNIYVNSFNHKFNPELFLSKIDFKQVTELHVAGFSNKETFYFDSHSKPAYPELFELYKKVLNQRSDLPVLFEWDEDIPEFSILEDEVLKFKKIWNDHGK